MGGCVGREGFGPRNHLILDVQQIIADDAWYEFVLSSRRRCKFRRMFMKRTAYTVEVPMHYYVFREGVPNYEKMKRLPSLQDNASKTAGSSDQPDQTNPEQIGLKTQFKNDTDKDQTYKFRFEKTRRATVAVTYQKGFSIGGSANFTLGMPTVLPGGELSAEMNMNYEVTSSKGQTFEETLTTEATSEIVVSKYSRCTANVIMEERRLLAKFQLRVTMSMPEKQALVFIKNKQGRVVFVKAIENLSMLFPEHTHILLDKDDSVREDAVQFVVHGVVDGMQLSNHYIHLKGRKIRATKPADSAAGVGGEAAKSGDANGVNDFSDVDMRDF